MIIESKKYGFISARSLVGCLCWFWDRREEKAKIGILADFYEDEDYPEQNSFYELEGSCYKHCAPVEDYEITFYADKDCSTAGKRRRRKEVADAIEDALEEEITAYSDEYENRPDINYIEAALKDNIHCAVLERDGVVNAVKRMMIEM